MLFPYDEFLKYFEYEDFDFSPRGLINCGNRYFTIKPLPIYMLKVRGILVISHVFQ